MYQIDEAKQRIVQELVPGRQITLAHIIANPDPVLYEKLGLDPRVEYSKSAIGVMTVSPAETAIIIADIAVKSSGAELGFGELAFNGVRLPAACYDNAALVEDTGFSPDVPFAEGIRRTAEWIRSEEK